MGAARALLENKMDLSVPPPAAFRPNDPRHAQHCEVTVFPAAARAVL